MVGRARGIVPRRSGSVRSVGRPGRTGPVVQRFQLRDPILRLGPPKLQFWAHIRVHGSHPAQPAYWCPSPRFRLPLWPEDWARFLGPEQARWRLGLGADDLIERALRTRRGGQAPTAATLAVMAPCRAWTETHNISVQDACLDIIKRGTRPGSIQQRRPFR